MFSFVVLGCEMNLGNCCYILTNLVLQIRGPLSSIRTLSKMLSRHMKKSEVCASMAWVYLLTSTLSKF